MERLFEEDDDVQCLKKIKGKNSGKFEDQNFDNAR